MFFNALVSVYIIRNTKHCIYIDYLINGTVGKFEVWHECYVFEKCNGGLPADV